MSKVFSVEHGCVYEGIYDYELATELTKADLIVSSLIKKRWKNLPYTSDEKYYSTKKVIKHLVCNSRHEFIRIVEVKVNG